jgi:hypothetical protein
VKLLATRAVADALGKQNSMRMQREVLSDKFVLAPLIRDQAKKAREHRTTVSDDHPLRIMEKQFAQKITDSLNQYRDRNNEQTVASARLLFGPNGLGAWFKPDAPDADVAHARAQIELAKVRASVLEHINEGGFSEAVCRIVLAGMASIGAFERRSFRLARLLAQLPMLARGSASPDTDWIALLKSQARITAVAPVEALNSLEHMLPSVDARESALAVSAAVMMIEPTLANPRSEIIEFLINTLGADPQRVITLALKLTQSLGTVAQPATKTKPEATKRVRTQRA